MRHRPSIPNNIQHWQVFEDDEQLHKFLETVDEFAETHADQENQNDPKSSKIKLLTTVCLF